jgi:hypothetical protein
MIDPFDIPDDLRSAFQRIIRQIPPELREDEHLFKITLAYLKLGGEKLARQGIEVAKEQHKQEVNRIRKLRRHEAMLSATSVESEEEQNDSESFSDEEDFDPADEEEADDF